MFIGTAGYTAPEQLMGDEFDGRADQYALAASAFHLLTGAPPFAHFNPSVVVNRQLNDRAPRPSEIRPDLTEFDAIFARALSKDPVDRFRRGRDLAKALESTAGPGRTFAPRPNYGRRRFSAKPPSPPVAATTPSPRRGTTLQCRRDRPHQPNPPGTKDKPRSVPKRRAQRCIGDSARTVSAKNPKPPSTMMLRPTNWPRHANAD